jgi:hypothetical protein
MGLYGKVRHLRHLRHPHLASHLPPLGHADGSAARWEEGLTMGCHCCVQSFTRMSGIAPSGVHGPLGTVDEIIDAISAMIDRLAELGRGPCHALIHREKRPMSQRDDPLDKATREIKAVVDVCWKAMISTSIAKGDVLIRFDELVAMEESSHEPLRRAGGGAGNFRAHGSCPRAAALTHPSAENDDAAVENVVELHASGIGC